MQGARTDSGRVASPRRPFADGHRTPYLCGWRPPSAGERRAGDSAPYPTSHSCAPGFTLIEVILAVTIAGALLAGAATLLVSITDAWIKRQDRHFFEDHVDGVTEFVQACFNSAGQEIALEGADDSLSEETDSGSEQTGQQPTATNDDENLTLDIPTGDENTNRNDSNTTEGGSLLRATEEPIGWSNPPGFAEFRDPLLHFGLKDTPPLLIQTENAPIIGVEAFLYFERDEGLSLLWYTPLQEESEDTDDLRRTPLSDLVTEIKYIYWDEDFEKWETEDEPMEGEGDDEFLLPRFLKLIFTYNEEEKQRIITIPVTSRSALIF